MYTMLCVSVRCFDGIHVFPQGEIFLICCITDSIIVGVSLLGELWSCLSRRQLGAAVRARVVEWSVSPSTVL